MEELSWLKKMWLKFTPRQFFAYEAKKRGMNFDNIDQVLRLFHKAERIDIKPLPSRSGRGFIIYVDNNLALFFYQDGDHFYFDGFEMGQYENGEVTVFDRLE